MSNDTDNAIPLVTKAQRREEKRAFLEREQQRKFLNSYATKSDIISSQQTALAMRIVHDSIISLLIKKGILTQQELTDEIDLQSQNDYRLRRLHQFKTYQERFAFCQSSNWDTSILLESVKLDPSISEEERATLLQTYFPNE